MGALHRRIAPPHPSPPWRPVAPSRLITPRRLCHQVVTPCWVGRWVGFLPLSPSRIRPLPVRIGTLWGIPGFRLPQGPHPLWNSSHPMTTRIPLHLCVESSHHTMTQIPPRPLRVKSSWDNSTPPPALSVAGSFVRIRFDLPPHSVAAPPKVFLNSGGLAAPFLPLHYVRFGAHSRGLTAPRVSPHSPGFYPLP